MAMLCNKMLMILHRRKKLNKKFYEIFKHTAVLVQVFIAQKDTKIYNATG